MLKTHWKKILLSVYVIVVLIISASVKANDKVDLKEQIAALSAEIQFLDDRGLLEEQAQFQKPRVKAEKTESLIGQFIIRSQFNGKQKVYFNLKDSSTFYQVDSLGVSPSDIDTSSTYKINGFVIDANAASNKAQLIKVLIVTSMKLQR